MPPPIATSREAIGAHHITNPAARTDPQSPISPGRRLLVVEAKGQWHKDLYFAAAAQLPAQYTGHQHAELQRIYLVCQFGPETPVAGRIQHGIATAHQLRERNVSDMPPELRGWIGVVVLNLAK